MGSVTGWLDELRAGERAAVQKLWERYFLRLVGLARERLRLRGLPRAAADEEDVALSAFDSFCRGAELGRFPSLADRDDLWQALVLITARKVSDLAEYEGRAKRDWHRGEEPSGPPERPSFPELISREPDPAFAAQVAEECQRLLAKLEDDELRTIALRKMEGCTNKEIAARLDCAVATVERRLRLIRKHWEQELRR